MACLDGIKNCHTRSKGWQLYFILIGDACLFVIRNCFLLGVAIVGTGSTGFLSRSLQLVYLLSSDVAESAWIFTLLAISSGFWCVQKITIICMMRRLCVRIHLYITRVCMYM